MVFDVFIKVVMTYRLTITVASGYFANSAWKNFDDYCNSLEGEYYPEVWRTELLKNGVVTINLNLGTWDIDFKCEANYVMFLLRWS